MWVLKGHQYGRSITALAISPEGSLLASGANDDCICWWDLATQTLVAHQPGLVSDLAFSPDGKTLASGGPGGITFWDRTGNTIGAQHPGRWPTEVAYAPNGRYLAWCGPIAGLFEGDPWVEKPLPTRQRASAVGTLAFAPNSQWFATAHATRTPGRRRLRHCVRLWNPASGKVVGQLGGQTQTTTALAFAPDSQVLAGTCGEYLGVWNITSREMIFSHRSQSLHYQDVAFTPDGRYLISASNDRTVQFWDRASWRAQAGYDWKIGAINCVVIAGDGMRAAAGSKKGRIVVWDVDL
jgi:WD40 repeat protein